MSTCAVSFDTGTLTGAVLPNAKLVFQSTDGQVRAVGVRIAPSERHEVTADALGQGVISLAWGNWTVTMISSLGQQTAAFSVPQAASGRLEAMLGAPLTSVYSLIQLTVLAAGGRGLFETPAAGRAATVNGDIFLAPLVPTGVGIYRRDSAASSPQIGSYFTGEVTATATDITAGRLLKVGDYGLGTALTAYTTDVDAITVNGGYRLSTGAFSTASPSPAMGVGRFLSHFNWDANAAHQTLYVQGGGIVRVFHRVKSGGIWGLFRESFTQQILVGTVSLAGGIPTGRVIERGNNANGEFVRFADGTQICWHRQTVSQSIGTAFMGGSRSGANSWTYPVAFVSPPRFIPVAADLTCFGASGFSAPTASSAAWVSTAVTTQATVTDRTADLIAIGRWA